MSRAIRASRLFAPTLKDAPADAVAASHQLLVRAGCVRQLGAGLYSLLPLGRRSLLKLERILRDEMDAVGGQEFLLPGLQPAELWRAGGRWDSIDETMFRLRDRRHGEYCLAMTHEEAFTALAAELQSYRQLPQIWYQIGLKFRDEVRPRAGLLRVREFQMKDAYSFDLDQAGLDASFDRMRAAYERIFRRCELHALPVRASNGTMGGRDSIEFVVSTPAGEDVVVACPSCGYAANLEVARAQLPLAPEETPELDAPESFPTPGILTIEGLAGEPFNVAPERQLKTLVYIVDGRPVVAVVRGDHQLNEVKLQEACGAASSVRPAQADEVFELMDAHPGSLGGVGFRGAPLLVDEELRGRINMVTGANRDGFHLRAVDVARDLLAADGARVADLRTVTDGEACPDCDGVLYSFSALEVGHIFKFGTRYSGPLSARVLAADGTEVPLVGGSYGIGLGRLLAAVVEQHHDRDGIIWPVSVAPFEATVLTLGAHVELAHVADLVVAELEHLGLDVLFDDRDERAGVKLKDADLIGIPLRISVSQRGLADGTVEWKPRASQSGERVALGELTERVRTWRSTEALSS